MSNPDDTDVNSGSGDGALMETTSPLDARYLETGKRGWELMIPSSIRPRPYALRQQQAGTARGPGRHCTLAKRSAKGPLLGA